MDILAFYAGLAPNTLVPYNLNVKLVINNRNIKLNQDFIFMAMFFILVFLLFFLPHADPDFGWHYRCGYEFIHMQKPCVGRLL